MNDPTAREIFTIRSLIVISVLSLIYFTLWFFNPKHIGNTYLYWMLAFAISYKLINVVYEWFLYWGLKVVKPIEYSKSFTVDVFTTACPGEPTDMIIDTLRAMVNMNYPHNNYLYDEGNNPVLKQACEQLGVIHITRSNRLDAKAGNINNALKCTSGDIVVILDPDHKPENNYLDNLLNYFNDESIGFVQSVQGYRNQEESLIAKGVAEQSYNFYGPLMMGMNSYGIVQAIGANCAFRRKALDSIGGHAPGLAEDMHTAMKLYSKKWRSVYVPKILTRGYVPSTLSAYMKQQLKWTCGCFNLLFEIYPKLFHKFTFYQKIHYVMAPIYFLSGFIFLIDLSVPTLSLFTGIVALKVRMVDFLFHFFPLIIVSTITRIYVQNWYADRSECGLNVLGIITKLGAWWIQVLGFVYALLRIKVPYIPTPKEGVIENNWKLILPNIFMVLISIMSVCIGLRNNYNEFFTFMAVFAVWNSLCLIMFSVISQQRMINEFSKSTKNLTMVKIGYLYRKYFYDILDLIKFYPLKFTTSILIVFFILNFYFNSQSLRANLISDTGNEYEVPEFGIYITELDKAKYNTFSPFESYNEIISKTEKLISNDIQIISLYEAWDQVSLSDKSTSIINKIYQNGDIVLITWEPWSNLLEYTKNDKLLKSNKKVFLAITEGKFDKYLNDYANKIKSFERNVFINFAHEMNNESKPWSQTGDNTADEFRDAWVYISDFFK